MRAARRRAAGTLLAAGVLVATATLGACAQPTRDGAAPTAAPRAHTAADVTFARDMIPHHQQALELAAMVPGHTGNPTLRAIATQIGADQTAEIRTLNGLLAGWHEPGPAPMPAGMPMHMTGMVDQPTMQRLTTLNDGAFDTLWVTSMIGHHQGAIDMARTEIAAGKDPDAIGVAHQIITAQQREIAMMNHLISATE